MRIVNSISVLLLAISLSACANLNYAMDEYGSVQLQEFEHNDSTYRMFDKPEAGKIMVTPSLGASMGTGFLKGLTLGIVDNTASEPVMHAAAVAFLQRDGKTCQVSTGILIQTPQWEFRYTCGAASPQASSQ